MTTMTGTRIVLCAATKWEVEPLARRWSLCAASAFRFEGTVRGIEVVLLKTGIGPANAQEALAALQAPKMIVSTGFAGALQPGMASGDLVLEVQGLDAEIPPMAREIALRQKTAFHFGRIAHTNRVLSRPEEKVSLGKAERASAVDMESASLRAAAERLGVPFLAARVVLDAVDERLPSDVPAGESFGALVSYAFRNASELPLMIKTGLRQGRAMSRLASFLEELLPKL